MHHPSELWSLAVSNLRSQLSDGVWHSTFAGIEAISVSDDQLVLSAPNAIAKDRVETRYLGLVTAALADAGAPGGITLTIEVRTEPADANVVGTSLPAAPSDATTSPPPGTAAPTLRSSGPYSADAASIELNPRYTFDSFVTGSSNRFAHAAALAVAETPARSYNPLFIYGDAGLGKTHLLQAIAHYVRDHYPSHRVYYVSTETLLNEFVESIRTNTMHSFKRRYREIDVLLVDDIQFIEGKEQMQEEFFHTFNTLHQADRQVVLSSDRPPDAMSTLEDRLRSRFKMGLLTDIQPPDVETRLAILRTRAESDNLDIDPDILDFIADNLKDNIRELEGALIRVTAFARLTEEPLTYELARKVLSDLVAEPEPRIVTPQLILEASSEHFDFTIEELQGASRRRPLVNARQVAMYVMRQLTEMSYPAIAREFGGRDHTTVIHAVDKINGLMSERRQTYDQVTALIHWIKTGEKTAAA